MSAEAVTDSQPEVEPGPAAPDPWWGEALRHLRRQRDWSQRQLARRAGVPKSTVADVETSRRSPSLTTLARLVAATGHRLEIVDPAGTPASWHVTDVSPRDAAGRRYPPHLDVRPAEPRVEMTVVADRRPWWSAAAPGGWTFHLNRARRDAFRFFGHYGSWGCGPPRPGGIDPEFVMDVWDPRELALFLAMYGPEVARVAPRALLPGEVAC
jgi:transcriptional regulator with XRE-family HTH domain